MAELNTREYLYIGKNFIAVTGRCAVLGMGRYSGKEQNGEQKFLHGAGSCPNVWDCSRFVCDAGCKANDGERRAQWTKAVPGLIAFETAYNALLGEIPKNRMDGGGINGDALHELGKESFPEMILTNLRNDFDFDRNDFDYARNDFDLARNEFNSNWK